MKPWILGTLRLHESEEIDALLSAGIPLDTADVYGENRGETQRRIARPCQTKVGLVRGKRWMPRGTAKHLTRQVLEAEQVLGSLPTVLLHAVDPTVPLERSWRALQKLKHDGHIARIGLCNVRVHEIRAVHAMGDLEVVQNALSPWNLGALESGVVRWCHTLGIEFQAHSAMGGWKRKRRVVPAWKGLKNHPALARAWLQDLGLVPIVGCTRLQTLRALGQPVDAVDLENARQALPQSRLAREPAKADGPGHLVLIAGLPASGKTTAAAGHVGIRANRDQRGGTLRSLVKHIADLLPRDVVADNTWADRVTRNLAVTAAQDRARVTLVHVQTGVDQCLVQAVLRILADGKGLPEPAQLTGSPPHWFAPGAIFKMAARWEPPTLDEGFSLQTAPASTLEWGQGAGRIVDLATLEAGLTEPSYGALWAPDEARRKRVERAIRDPLLLDHRVCTHAPGPPKCWCRKPLPGMAVDLMSTHGLDPARTTFVGGSAERVLAERLGACFAGQRKPA